MKESVSEWLRRYRRDGEAGLRQAGRAGRKPLLDAAQLERLEALLLEGPEAHGFPTPLWSCPRVARLIGDEFGVRYHEGHVWKILRALGWSPQRPVGKARERNEEAIRGWQRKTWPAIKKKPAKKNVRWQNGRRMPTDWQSAAISLQFGAPHRRPTHVTDSLGAHGVHVVLDCHVGVVPQIGDLTPDKRLSLWLLPE